VTSESREGGGKGAARKILRRGREVTKHASGRQFSCSYFSVVSVL